MQKIRDWYDRNFTIKGFVSLLVLIYCAIPDWKSRNEFWSLKLHAILAVLQTGYGRLVVIVAAAIVIWLDHRTVIKKQRAGLPDEKRQIGDTKKPVIESLATQALPVGSSTKEPRKTVNVTPEHLIGFFNEQHTSIQAAKLAEAYIGKWLTVSGPIGDVLGASDLHRMVVFANRTISSYNTVNMFFRDKEQFSQLSTLRRGDNITVIGKITEVNAIQVSLDECELVGS